MPAFPGAIHCRTFQLSIQQVVTGSNPVDPTIEAWNPDVFKTSGFQAFRLQTRSGYRPDCVSDGLVLFGRFGIRSGAEFVPVTTGVPGRRLGGGETRLRLTRLWVGSSRGGHGYTLHLPMYTAEFAIDPNGDAPYREVGAQLNQDDRGME